MDLSLYKPNALEHWIANKYIANGFSYPSDLDIDLLAGIFKIIIRYHDKQTKAVWNQQHGLIYILESYSEYKRRAIFFHELCHILRHAGDQSHMHGLFIQLQEVQAAQFQLYAAMPFYMVEPYSYIKNSQEYISTLANDFKLPVPFVEKRIAQIQRRIKQAEFETRTTCRNTVTIDDEYVRNLQAELGRRRAAMNRGYD